MAYRVRIRRFLNLKGFSAGAYVLAEVQDSRTLGEDERRWGPDIALTLADCSRAVSFDFDLSTAAQRRNSLRKVDIMVSALTESRAALAEEAALAAESERKARRGAR
ncbi:MAG: hypothetical protein ACRDLB_04415 [Actinomycetota bacterium]